MKKPHKILLAVAALVVIATVCALLDRWHGIATERTAALDAQYEEMIYAMVQGQAPEQSTNHPMNRLYRARHEALVAAGYLKTREFPLQHGFESSRASWSFISSFASKFPGVDRQIRSTKPGQPPVFVVCARDRDLLAIKLFIMQNETAK